MSLIVEDGSGLSTAESYCSVADANAYHTAFDNDDWVGSDAAKEAALRNATQYLDNKYFGRWIGDRGSLEQALEWPRNCAETLDGFYLPNDEIPTKLIQATAQMALHALSNDLFPTEENPGTLQSERVKVGPIEEELSYQGGSPAATRYTKSESLVKSLIQAQAGVQRA